MVSVRLGHLLKAMNNWRLWWMGDKNRGRFYNMTGRCLSRSYRKVRAGEYRKRAGGWKS